MNARTTDELERFEQLLNRFQKLPPLEEGPKTFLQICGFPHRETVMSNILAFFFDPRREHGLEGVFLRSLLEAYDSKFRSSYACQECTFEDVVREEQTDDEKLIDLMISAKPLLIGIENKIYAQASYNPFERYSAHLAKKADEEEIRRKNIVKILLSLRKESADGKHGFRPITYDKFFQQLSNNLGHHVLECKQQYRPFLIDFMKTIGNAKKEADMDHQLCAFLKEGKLQSDCVQFYARLTKFKKGLRSRIKSVRDKVRVPGFTCKTWCALDGGSEKVLYDSLNFSRIRTLSDGTRIEAQVSLGLSGWEVVGWPEPKKPSSWQKSRAIPKRRLFSFDEPEEQIAGACTKLLKALAKLS